MSSPANPPGDMNLTIAILALIGAILSIIGFVAQYVPHKQYAGFCDIIGDINSNFELSHCQWPSEKRSRLWRQYYSVSANVELYHYLVMTPRYRSVFHVQAAWRLRNLIGSALKLKLELIALSQIRRSNKLREIMEMSLSPTSTISSDTTIYDNTAPPPSSRWWRWSKTPQATARKAVDDCERLPV